MSKQLMEITPGVKYSGYGVLNEYGEWSFIPSQVGSRKGRKKFICGDNDYTIYTTSNKVIVHMSFGRGERISVISKFCKLVDKCLLAFKDYDFRRISPDRNKGREDCTEQQTD